MDAAPWRAREGHVLQETNFPPVKEYVGDATVIHNRLLRASLDNKLMIVRQLTFSTPFLQRLESYPIGGRVRNGKLLTKTAVENIDNRILNEDNQLQILPMNISSRQSKRRETHNN